MGKLTSNRHSRLVEQREAIRGSMLIQVAAEKVGVSPSVLRAWEGRYGWPKPLRIGGSPITSSHVRVYVPHQIENLQHAVSMIKRGWTIGQLVRDGMYISREVEQAGKEVTARAVFELPEDDRAWIREELAVALERKAMAIVARELASLGIYPPQRRQAIVRSVEAADRFHGGCFKPLLDRYVHRMPSITSRSA